MNKLSHQIAEEWVPHSYEPVFSIVVEGNAAPKIVGSIPSGDVLTFERLATCMQPPYFLLYVLHTPRGEATPGRYQSPPVSIEQLRGFLKDFGSFLASDARFDIWAHSAVDRATVVWDRHNQLFAYGLIEKFSSELRSIGFLNGVVDISFPHQHHYRQEFDEQATAVLNAFDWSYSPLRAEDEQ